MMNWLFGRKTKSAERNSFLLGLPMMGTTILSKKVAFSEGYQKNAIVFKCIGAVAKAAAGIDLYMMDKNGKEVEKHPVLDVLKRPNPTQSGDEFLKEGFTNFQATGEMFVAAVRAGSKLKELWQKSPVDMKVNGGKFGLPLSFEQEGENKQIWPVDQITGKSDMFFFKEAHPLDKWRGMSPLEAAALSVDGHNAGLTWNYSLLRNGARPSGIVKFTGNPSDETILRLRELFKRRLQGAHNAGEIPMLVDGAEWQPTDSNPRDMDYISSLKEYTKYIAGVLGVPLPLVDNDAASMNNMQQAKELLYTDTVIPLLKSYLEALNFWLKDDLQGNTLCIDLDTIAALEGLRKQKFERVGTMFEKGIISVDEARAELGFEPFGGVAASLLVPAGKIPLDMAGFGLETEKEQDEAKALRAAGFDDVEVKNIIQFGRAREEKSEREQNIILNMNMGETKNDVHLPAPVVTFSPEIKTPSVTVNNKVERQEQKAPIVNVSAPSVSIKNEIPTINVKLPERQSVTTVTYDDKGNIVNTVKVEKDKK